MREILFKAKRTDNGEWVEGYCFKFMDKSYIADMERTFMEAFYTEKSVVDFHMRAYEVEADTLCQHTGFLDKKGHWIWENDIVERIDRRNGIYVFREQPKMNCKVVWTDRHGYDTNPSCGYFDRKNAYECKVIGNIFDNSELVERN